MFWVFMMICLQLGKYLILTYYQYTCVCVYVCRLGEGPKQSNGRIAKYSCVGNEQSLDDCSFNVDETACQLPASSIVACSKSCLSLIMAYYSFTL